MIDKLYFYVIITVVFFLNISRHYNRLKTNKQIIDLLYNDVKNLTLAENHLRIKQSFYKIHFELLHGSQVCLLTMIQNFISV